MPSVAFARGPGAQRRPPTSSRVTEPPPVSSGSDAASTLRQPNSVAVGDPPATAARPLTPLLSRSNAAHDAFGDDQTLTTRTSLGPSALGLGVLSPPLPVPQSRRPSLGWRGPLGVHGFGYDVELETAGPLPDLPWALVQAPGALPTPAGRTGAAATTTATGTNVPEPSPGPRSGERAKPVVLGKRNVPPFWFSRETDQFTSKALAFPPLFLHRKPKPGFEDRFLHANLSLTFGWWSKRKTRREWLSVTGLFFGAFAPERVNWTAVPILTTYRRTNDQFRLAQFPLVWWWGNKYVKNLFILPLHYHQKGPDLFQGVSGFLVWYGHRDLEDQDPNNDRKHFVFAPLYVGLTRGQKRFDFAPIYYSGRNRVTGLNWRHLAGVFHWQSSEFGNRRELWTLPYVRRTDRARGRTDWAIPPLLTISSQTRERALLTVTPLFWRVNDRIRDRRTTAIGPVGWQRDPTQTNAWVAPILWHSRDVAKQTSGTLVAPVVYTRRSPTRFDLHTPVLSLMLPRGGANAPRAGGVPVALTMFGRRADGSKWGVVPGAGWSLRPATATAPRRDTVAVLIGGYARRGDDITVGVAPLGIGGRRGSMRWGATLLGGVARDPARNRTTVAIANVYAHRAGTGADKTWQAGVVPLWFGAGGPDLAWQVAPFLLTGHVARPREGTTLTLSPFYVDAKRPHGRTRGFALLGWDVRDGDARTTMALPVYVRHRSATTTTWLTPLGGARKTASGLRWVGALAYGERTAERARWGVVPLVYRERRFSEATRGDSLVVFPLFARDRRPESSLDVWSPLVWRTSYAGAKPRQGLVVFPMYFRQRQPGGVDVDAGLGWFWSRDAVRHTHTLIAGPFFHRLSRKQVHTGLAPISWWMDSETKRRLIALPGIVHVKDKSKNEWTTVAFPVWFDRRKANTSRTWFAFPFVLSNKRLFDFTRVGLGAAGYVDAFRIYKNMRITGYFPLLYRYQKCGFQQGDDPKCRYTAWGSFPLFLYGKDGKGRLTHAAAMLYYFDKNPRGKQVLTLLGGGGYYPKRRAFWYAGPVFRDVTKHWATTAVVPLFFHKQHRRASAQRSTTVVLPPLFIGQRKGDKRWWEGAALVWQFRSPVQVTTAVVPPIFLHQHAYRERRLTWFLPIFAHDDRMGVGKRFTTALPLLAFDSADRVEKRRNFVQFPLVWHFSRRDRSTTIGAFAWYDIRREGRTTQVLPALLVRRVDAKGTLGIVGPALAWWSKSPEGLPRESAFRILFGLFGGGEKDGRRYAVIFGAKVDRGPAPPPKPPRVKASRRGKGTTSTEDDAKAQAAPVGTKSGATRRGLRRERVAAPALTSR